MQSGDARFFLSEAATLLESGIPVQEALDYLAAQPKRSIASLARELSRRIGKGESLAGALRRSEGELAPELVAMIEAGEKSGNLPEILKKMAAEIERRIEIRGHLILKTLYPLAVLALASLGPPLFLVVQGRTGTYLAIQAAVFVPLIALAAAAWAGLRYPRELPRLSRAVETALSALPLVGPALRRIALGRALALLGLLIESGVSLGEALPLVASAAKFREIAEGFSRAGEAIRRGRSAAEALQAVPSVPDVQRIAIETGERSGTLDRALQDGGARLVEGAWKRFEALAATLPVALYVIAGVVVLLLALSVFGRLMGPLGGGE